MSKLPPTRFSPSIELMNVWHVSVCPGNGPTFSSLLGIVRLNGSPAVFVNVSVSSESRSAISEHGIPYAVPYSVVSGAYALMFGEMYE